MKNLKKVLSLVLALAMALSLMTAAFAADASDYKDYSKVTYKEAVDVMTAAGIFNGGDGNNFNPDATLNREQAAKIITYMLVGQEKADKLTTTVAPYADVAATRWSAGSIAYCTNEGIIAGDGNGRFNPTAPVLGTQFAKMLLVALGYDAEIEKLVGNSWAINTAKLAASAGLDKGLDISLSAALTREQAAQMAFNAMKATLVEYEDKGGDIIIGDIPIYVAFDSADAWAHPELFQLDEHGRPSAVAGCPPDGFSATGQLWGNPLYRWDYHAQTGYVWWISRLRHCFTLYDVVRVDHFRGFDEYYAIPYGDKTAENGVWKKGPGIDLFHTVKKELGDVNIIAEDLGYLTESVMKLVEDTGYPGMKVLQFAFDSREESNYLPHNYPHNCVVYTGTHDNNTVRGWLDDMCEEDNALAEDYMNNADTPKDERPWEFIRLALGSVADLAVIPLQDYLCLGTEARINLPSTLGNNWKWRLVPGQVTDEMLEKMCHLNKLFGRL